MTKARVAWPGRTMMMGEEEVRAMATATDKVVHIRAKAFTGESIRAHRCLVDASGNVRVWDSVAGHYTTCHALTKSAQQRARKAAGLAV